MRAQSLKALPEEAVVVGLLDGTSFEAKVVGFSSLSIDIEFLVEPASRRRTVPGEKIAYIAMKGKSETPAFAIKRKVLRLHVAGSKMFDIEVDQSALAHPLGFFARPTAESSPFKKIYFYAHGINAREMPEMVGDLLLNQGLIDADGLRAGLAEQQKNRDTQIGDILMEQAHLDREVIEQALQLQKRKPVRIGELLIEAGWIDAAQLGRALEEQKNRKNKRVGEILVDQGFVTEEVLATTLANKFLLPLVDLATYTIESAAAYAVPKELIAKHRILPVREAHGTLTIAISDPLAVDAIEAVRLQVRRKIQEVMVVPSQLNKFVAETLARLEAEAVEAGMEQLLEEIEQQDRQDTQSHSKDARDDLDESDNTVIRLVNRIIIEAYRRGASDIHIEPQGKEEKLLVRLRVDGVCEVYQELPPSLRRALCARVKIMASLDIAERRLPQDGKIRFQTRSGAIELRVATLPTPLGDEDIVLRILASSKPLAPDSMKFSSQNLKRLLALIKNPYGLFLCVGPTGSGKTTTLHSIVGTLNTRERKIWTAEDPVEITQLGLRQVQMQPKIGLTFATALRAFLRADPDIVMVGEMRDHETAHIGVEASLTGHLVFSTLHTNSAPETIIRLIDMGLDPFSFADALLGVLAQRLARALCSKCKVDRNVTAEELAEVRELYGQEFETDFPHVEALKFWAAEGCEQCKLSGYKGRVGIHELLSVDDPLRVAIGRRAPVSELRQLARAGGMRTLLQDGIQKVFQGETDLKQVLAVCSR